MITKAEKRKKAKGYVAGLFDMDGERAKVGATQLGGVGNHQARDRQLASERATGWVLPADKDRHLMRAPELVREDARPRRTSASVSSWQSES